MTDNLRIGLIGAGYWMLSSIVPTLVGCDECEIVAVSRRNVDMLAKIEAGLGVRGYTNWNDMLEHESMDAVIVATSHMAHAEPTIAALGKGLHVLVEKPMAATSKDAWAMVDAHARSGKILMVGHQARFLPAMRALRQAAASGSIGEVRQIQVTWSQDSRLVLEGMFPQGMQALLKSKGMPEWLVDSGLSRGDWRTNPIEMGGGLFADTGSHYTDLALWLAGSIPLSVVAFAEPLGAIQEQYINVDIRMANGVLVSICANTLTPGDGTGAKAQFRLLGDDGSLTCDGHRVVRETRQGSEELAVVGARVSSVQAFVSAIRGEQSEWGSPEEAARVVEVTEAAYTSAREAQVVRLASHRG